MGEKLFYINTVLVFIAVFRLVIVEVRFCLDEALFFCQNQMAWVLTTSTATYKLRLNSDSMFYIIHKVSTYSALHDRYIFVAEYKSNFSRIENMVLIGGPDDGVITPWQSR